MYKKQIYLMERAGYYNNKTPTILIKLCPSDEWEYYITSESNAQV